MMKKKSIFLLGMLAALLALGLVLAGCNTGCPRGQGLGGDCDVQVDSSGSFFGRQAFCDNGDCRAVRARTNRTPGRHRCSC